MIQSKHIHFFYLKFISFFFLKSMLLIPLNLKAGDFKKDAPAKEVK